MKVSTVYKKAAKFVFDNSRLYYDYYYNYAGCVAIKHVLPDNTEQVEKFVKSGFAEVFMPSNTRPNDPWFGSVYNTNEEQHIHNRDHRIFALLFMHELAKDAGI